MRKSAMQRGAKAIVTGLLALTLSSNAYAASVTNITVSGANNVSGTAGTACTHAEVDLQYTLETTTNDRSDGAATPYDYAVLRILDANNNIISSFGLAYEHPRAAQAYGFPLRIGTSNNSTDSVVAPTKRPFHIQIVESTTSSNGGPYAANGSVLFTSATFDPYDPVADPSYDASGCRTVPGGYTGDTTPPELTVPTSFSVDTDSGANNAVVTYTAPTANDNIDGVVTPTRTAGLASGATFPLGDTIVTYRAEDAVGNSTTKSFTVTVVDNEIPNITVPANITKTTDPGSNTATVNFTVGAVDNVDDPITPTVTTSPTLGLSSGSAFPIGTTTVSVLAEDAAGNSDTKQFTITIGDGENPEFPSTQSNINIDIPFDESTAIVTYPTPTAADNSGSVTVTRTSGLASGSAFPVGTTTITHRAEDAAGNFADQSFDVIVARVPPGTLEVRVNSSADGNVGLSSSASAFNQTINISGGSGTSGQMLVRPGNYSATFALPTGFVLTSSSCDSTDGQVLPSLSEIQVDLVSDQNIVCTLTMFNSVDDTSEQIQNFIDGRARQIISNQPGQNRRLARIQGNAAQPGGFNLFGFQAPNAGHLPVAVNVASDAIELNYPTAQIGQQRQDWDAWAEATFSRFETDIDAGNFATLHMGYDYLLSPTSIIGIGASIDYTHANLTGSTGYTNGFGFMVGPYYTGEISEDLYLDITAKIGRSFNNISTAGTAEDQFGATRGLLNASLFGEVELDQLTVRPEVSLNYFYERTDAFVNNFGLTIAEQETRLGDLTFGTTFAWSQPLENGWHLTPYVALNGIWTFDSATANGASTINNQLRAKTEFGLTLNGDANQSLDFAIAYDGIGDPNYQALSAKFGLSVGF